VGTEVNEVRNKIEGEEQGDGSSGEGERQRRMWEMRDTKRGSEDVVLRALRGKRGNKGRGEKCGNCGWGKAWSCCEGRLVFLETGKTGEDKKEEVESKVYSRLGEGGCRKFNKIRS
jgi:hypothetical protein